MSSKHSIDKLFRTKLDNRAFRAEPGELDEMRALLDVRNAAQAAQGGTARWALWSLVVVPAAALIWWYTDAPEQVLSNAPTRDVEALVAEAPIPVVTSELEAFAVPGEPTPQVVPVVGDGNSGGAVPHGSVDVPEQGRPTEAVRLRMMRPEDASHVGALASEVVPGSLQEDVNSTERDAISRMDILRIPDESHAKAPVTAVVDPESYRSRALGDLHFVASALGTDADGRASGSGSTFGLEYRMRRRHLSVATGVQYGSYALRSAGDGANDEVDLEYMQVPLLAGYELGFGRLGLLVQGGLSCDFFFGASGRYGSSHERSPATIEDAAFRSVNVSMVVRPQMIYRATDRIGLVAGPVWSEQLSGLALEGSLDGARMRSVGASFGLVWRLERATY